MSHAPASSPAATLKTSHAMTAAWPTSDAVTVLSMLIRTMSRPRRATECSRLLHHRASLRGEALLEGSGHRSPRAHAPGARHLEQDPETGTGPPGDHADRYPRP